MKERFRFDRRVKVPEATDGKVVVKCYGLPMLVSVAKPDEIMLGGCLSENQLREVAQAISQKGVDALAEQKRNVAQGRLQ